MNYRHDLDVLKGLAIVAVVLYHAGWCMSLEMKLIKERRFCYIFLVI
jgi:uncharacterized membrane protein